MQPSEFWSLSSQEFWWEYDTKIESHKRTQKGLGGHSIAEWEEARRKHRKKMNDGTDRATREDNG